MPTSAATTSPGGIATQTILENQFPGGMNATQSAEFLPPGTLRSLVNGMVIGATNGEGGYLQTRPGKRAQLAAVLPGPITDCIRFRKPDGTRCLIMAVASSSVSTTGYLYQWNKGDTTATQLTVLGTFNVYQVQFAVLGTYVWAIGSTANGAPVRYDLSGNTDPGSPGGHGVAIGQATPTTAPTVSLTNLPIDTTSAGTNWSIDNFGGNAVTDVVNPSFTGGGSFPPGYSGWKKSPGSIIECVQPISGDTTWYVRLDDAPSSIQSIDGGGNFGLQDNRVFNSYYDPVGVTLPKRYCTHFVFSALYYTDSGGAQDSVTITVIVYSDAIGTVEIARRSQTFAPGAVGAIVSISHVFDFSFIDPTLPLSYSVILGPGLHNRPGNNGPYLTLIHCSPYLPQPSTATAGSGNTAGQTVIALPNGQNSPDEKTTLFLGNARISHDLGAATDLSSYETIVFTFTESVPLQSVRARLVLKTGLTAAGVMTDVLILAEDTTGVTFLYVDISSIAPGNRNAVRYLDILFLSDILLADGYTSGGQPFSLGPLTNAGGKSIALPYFLRFTESVNTTTAATEIESGGSPISVEVDPDGLHATITATLPAPVNSNADGYNIYIEGGVESDGFFRLENSVPIATGITTWPGLTWNGGTGTYTGTGVTWNPTTRVYTTSIPDSSLFLAALFADHQPPPSSTNPTSGGVAAQAIAVYNDRLLLACGSRLYISALTTGVSAGLYWNFVPSPSDPNYKTEGTSIVVGGVEGTTTGDLILRMTTYRSRCLLFFENHLFVLSGLSNIDFDVNEYVAEDNEGVLAPNAAAVIENGVYFLAASGLHGFNLAAMNRKVSQPIARLLNPAAEFAGPALSASAYAQSSLVPHEGRLLLSVPTSTSGANIGVTYVLDMRQGGIWYQWNLGAVLCGASFAGSSDTDDLIVGCADGMLYSLGNAYGDTATSAASPTGVTLAWRTREYTGGVYDFYGMRFGTTFSCADASVVPTFGVYGDNPATQKWNFTYTAPSGETSLHPPTKVSSVVRGRELYMDGSVTTVNPFTLQKLELVVGLGRRV